EVALGKMATEKSQNDDVKKFGQMMVDDHSKAEQELEGVASKNNLQVPKEVGAEQKAEQQRLEKLSGAAFDRAYMQMMVKDHVKDVAEFKKEAANTSANSDVKDFATRTYPTLDNHLTHAKAVHDAMNKSGSNGKVGRQSENCERDRKVTEHLGKESYVEHEGEDGESIAGKPCPSLQSLQRNPDPAAKECHYHEVGGHNSWHIEQQCGTQ